MIRFSNVSKAYQSRKQADNAAPALHEVSFTVDRGEAVSIIGPSGSGKSTLIKCVNRLVEFDAGSIEVEGVSIRERPLITLRRSLGYVLQHIGLFPHLTIAENIGILCRLEKWPAARIHSRVDELLHLVRLAPEKYSSRFPVELSGGEQQRVGIARALALDPPCLLMDEPFGALDPLTRHTIQTEFVDLHRSLKKTVIIVTHDLPEAFLVGQRTALLAEGRLLQIGTAAELLSSPASEAVARFTGAVS